MTYMCDRCGSQMKFWRVNCFMSEDDKADEPDFPPEASDTRIHLCSGCRKDFQTFLSNTPS